MDYHIVTNNPRVRSSFSQVIYLEDDCEAVMTAVRDLLHLGYPLVSHPMGASIRMIFSPYRSIVVGPQGEKPNLDHIEVLESSLRSYRQLMRDRNQEQGHEEDYKAMDLELLGSVLAEERLISKG